MGSDWYTISSSIVEGYGYEIQCDTMSKVINDIHEISTKTGMKWVGIGSILKDFEHWDELQEADKVYGNLDDEIYRGGLMLGKESVIIFYEKDIQTTQMDQLFGPYDIERRHRFNNLSFVKLDTQTLQAPKDKDLKFIGHGTFLIVGSAGNFVTVHSNEKYEVLDKIKDSEIYDRDLDKIMKKPLSRK